MSETEARIMDEAKLEEDVYTCASCGYCRFNCPVYKVLGIESATVRGRMLIMKKLLEGKMEFTPELVDSMYMCAQCEGCHVACPNNIDFVMITQLLRQEMVKQGLLPESFKMVRENLVNLSNPYGEPQEQRGAWLPPNLRKEPKQSENLYFVGCTASYSLNRIPKSVMRILDSTEFDYTALGDNELCCGAPIFRMGETELGNQMIRRNVENIRKLGVKTIFASCAGCYSTMKHNYPDEFEYLHITQLFERMLEEGTLKFKRPFKKRVIYYDGCDLGRHGGVYEAPRNVLKAIPEIEVIEFDYNRENAMCCGGPLSSGYPDLAHNIAARTVLEAHEKNADMIVTACAACLVNFKEGAKIAGVQMDVQDIPMLLTRVA